MLGIWEERQVLSANFIKDLRASADKYFAEAAGGEDVAGVAVEHGPQQPSRVDEAVPPWHTPWLCSPASIGL